MNYSEYISRQIGNFILSDSMEFENILEKKDLIIGDNIIKVNDYTDLYGFFNTKLRFCGFLREKEAIFYLGSQQNIFKTEYYYELIYILKPTRIGKIYRLGTFRDLILVEKNNKKIWK
ncbi:MAG: hypothetical protein LBF04_07115 [Prevotellaceae bacterium]|nr:hypothetical protein [Prevotellaceae bacterium]